MKYRHIPTGVVVNSDAELPPALYEKIAEKEDGQPAEKEPKKARKKAK